MGGKETRLFQAIDGAYNDAAVQSDDEIKRFYLNQHGSWHVVIGSVTSLPALTASSRLIRRFITFSIRLHLSQFINW
ncbi:prebacteriocin [Lacticaseibacillus casei 21/1]|nr:prebacteriocin [Lacticaseibacillus casei 21/1]